MTTPDLMDLIATVPESAQRAQGCPTRWSFRTYVEDVREARAALAAYRPSPPERCRIAAALVSTIDQTPALQQAIAVAVLPTGDRRPVIDWSITWDPGQHTPRLVRPSPVAVGAEVPARWILARIRADVYARSTFAAHLRRYSLASMRRGVPGDLRRAARRLPSARRAAGRQPLWRLVQGETPPLLPARWAEVDREQRRQAALRDERRQRRRILTPPSRRIPRCRLGIPYAVQLGRDPRGRLQIAYWCDEGTWHRDRREALACAIARRRQAQARGRRWFLVRLIRGSWRRWRLLVGRAGKRVPVATYRVRPSRAQIAAALRYWRRFARLAYREPRLGWRKWDVTDEGILVSPYQATPWPGPRLAAAGWDHRGSVRGQVGIHAYALTLDRGDWRWSDATDGTGRVLGLVLAEGDVVRGPEGWRAQAARILALHVPDALAPVAPILAQRYGVPVTVE
jgi:hypothetical protein